MSRDVFVTAYMPVLSTGFGLRTFGVVRALAAHGPVDLVHGTFGGAEPAPAFLDVPGLTLHEVPGSRGPRRAAAYLAARSRDAPASVARGASAELTRTAARLAASGAGGRVIANGPEAAAATLTLAGRHRLVYNAHNVDSSFRHRLGDGDARSQQRLERFERRVLTTAAEAWMVSRRDLALAAALAPGRPLRYVPNVVDVAAVDPVGPAGEPNVLMVGDFRYAPNRDGLRFLLDEALPRLWAARPDARLTVVGRGLDGPPSPDARVIAPGFVEELASAYASAACVAVPLRVGGGSPLKFVEALAHGLPVVATPVAAQGLEVTAGEHYREGADGPAFAHALAAVLSGEDPGLGARGRALAEREYSLESLVPRVAP